MKSVFESGVLLRRMAKKEQFTFQVSQKREMIEVKEVITPSYFPNLTSPLFLAVREKFSAKNFGD